MAKIKWIDDRLENWALWRERRGGIGGLGYARLDLTRLGGASTAEAVIPVNDLEASAIDEEVQKLDDELQDTLFIYYCRTTSRSVIASSMGCSTAAVDARLTRAHKLLAQAIGERERAAAARAAQLRESAVRK